MRAGLATVKFGGTLFSGSLVVMRTTVLPACCADVEGLDAVLRWRRRDRPSAASQSRSAWNAWSGFGIHRFASTSCSELMRSTQSPPLSWTTSLRLICASSIAVMTPKFWPM